MKHFIAMSISEMECDDVTFEIDFEAWTDTIKRKEKAPKGLLH